ncbi:DUF883 family protein [Salinicola sp. LHM]|jgi:ElaB/YqjD/DUF883 family membrane-anchored ribosome-binding protein|uniref:DUF883 family protein n=1 Tax=Salinicola TaxID=404432 RepID=UPI0008DE328B|nr:MULTISPECIES: DUF883 family protein [Salinicola]MDF3919270.1 DUF883 family protein [Salinicola salarius]MEC8917903.1 DUF883 family protein [Pseudomonadota bacterium]OHZ04034.1 hypothetical protein BC443_06065 [Salinicola sp. MIT1003]WQH34383.1 DUF883 family protein [Salinicola sp. LHM]
MSLFKREDREARTDRIRADLDDIGDQAQALGRDLRDDTQDAIEEARLQSEAQYARMADQARQRNRRVKRSANQSVNECDRYVREHPWSSIGAATLAGAVIGLLIGRR